MYGVHVHFIGGQTLKNLLVSPKDKDILTKKNSVIHWFRCDKIDCDEEYIGDSSRTFGDIYKKNTSRHLHLFVVTQQHRRTLES